MFQKLHIYDVDGVLLDSSHRYRNKPNGSIDLDYWFMKATPENIAKDKPLPLAKQYASDCLNPHIYVIVCTARAYSIADRETIEALGKPNKLLMRPRGNMENDAKLKRKQLVKLLNLKQFNRLQSRFWDDNIKNLDALRDRVSECFLIKSRICDES